MRADELPSWKVILNDAHLLIPILTLVVLLHSQFSPNFSAFWSLVTMIVVSSLRTHTRSEEHTSELQSLMRISYAVFCLKKKRNKDIHHDIHISLHKTT